MEVPQIQFSPVIVDIPVVQQRRVLDLAIMAAIGVGGAFFGGIDAIFRAPQDCPGVERQCSSPRELTPVSARGLLPISS